jgi:hypothetical protein
MHSGVLDDAGIPNSLPKGFLEGRWIDMKSTDRARQRIDRQIRRGKDPVPAPLLAGARVLPRQRIGQDHARQGLVAVPVVESRDGHQMPFQVLADALREDRLAVFPALAATDRQAVSRKVHVFHSQRKALLKSQPSPVDGSPSSAQRI